MQDQEDHQHVVVGCKDQMQMIMKGKRTKRQRLPSPLRLTMSTTTTSNSSATTTTTSIDHELRNSTTEEEEDMANCLILLAQGNHHHTHKKLASSKLQLVDLNNNNNNNKERLYLYECKTCNRCFSSFQALGGHRASHKKLKANNAAASCAPDQKEAITTTFVNDHHGFDHPTNTNTNLTLQLSSRGLYGSSTVTPTTTKSKVHECSICGAEFQSGQALGGHMRRHRISVSNSAAISMSDIGANNQEAKKAKNNVLKLDLNLPAPEDDNNREPKFPFQSKEKVIVFSATSLVDCHY